MKINWFFFTAHYQNQSEIYECVRTYHYSFESFVTSFFSQLLPTQIFLVLLSGPEIFHTSISSFPAYPPSLTPSPAFPQSPASINQEILCNFSNVEQKNYYIYMKCRDNCECFFGKKGEFIEPLWTRLIRVNYGISTRVKELIRKWWL